MRKKRVIICVSIVIVLIAVVVIINFYGKNANKVQNENEEKTEPIEGTDYTRYTEYDLIFNENTNEYDIFDKRGRYIKSIQEINEFETVELEL